MTKHEFISSAYEILSPGLIEVDGKLYYSEESVLKAMEWMANNITKIVEVDTEKMIENIITNLTKRITL